MNIGELLVKIKADDNELKNSLSGMQEKLKSFAMTAAATLGAAFSFSKFTGFLKESIQKAADAETTNKRLEQVLKSTGNAAGITAEEAKGLASSLSQVTTFSSSSIKEAETLLFTFTKIGKDVFPQATEAVLDLSLLLGQDLKSSAIQLGKALQDPIQGVSALRRVGVQLSSDQTNQIKQFVAVNDIMGAQKVILGELATQTGGQARAATDTYNGSLQQLTNTFSQFKSSIGESALKPLTTSFQLANDVLQDMTKSIKIFNQENIVRQSIEKTQEALDLAKKYKDVAYAQDNINAKLKEATLEFRKQMNILDEMQGRPKRYSEMPVNQKQAGQEYLPEQISAYQASMKSLQDINLEYKKRELENNNDKIGIINLEEKTALAKLATLKIQTGENTANQELMIALNAAKKRELAEKENDEKIKNNRIKMAQLAFSTMSGIVGQFGAIANQINTNVAIEFDNKQHEGMERIKKRYDSEKLAIEGSVDTQKEKDKKLEALDQKRARDEKKLNEKLEKDKRKAAREAASWQKAIAIAQATTNIAQGITAVWSTAGAYGVFGPGWAASITALIAALGATQIGLIAAQPLPALAAGGVFTGPAIVGEKGKEMAFPLDGAEGKAALAEMASALGDYFGTSKDDRATTSKSSQKASQPIVLSLDGNILARWTSDQIENGNVIVTSRNYQ